MLLKSECEELKKQLSTNEKIVEVNNAKVEKLSERQDVWKKKTRTGETCYGMATPAKGR